MPSYIELDKQATFSASSDVSKVILGINNNNVLQITNNDGQSFNASPSYKVFTALLTQNGSSPDLQPLVNAPLTIGKTYRITSVGEGNDWTVVGAPNNNINTLFIATGENATWGIDGELEYDTTEATPVITILENTIGNVWFEYSGVGLYRLNSNNLFPPNKTMIIGSTYYYDGETTILLSSYYGTNSEESIMLQSTNLGTLSDSALYYTPLEIRVYY
jgi:hypothetical protein